MPINRDNPPLKSTISAADWSEWRDSNARLPAPKAGALPTGLHPEIRQKKLASFRFRLAAKTAHPLLPSSSPNRTRFAGLRFGIIKLYYTTLAVVVKHVVISIFFQRKAGKGKPPRPQQNKGFPSFAPSPPRQLRTRSQSTRATNCATPGCRQKKLAALRFCGLRKGRENCAYAPSFFLSKSKPQTSGFDLANVGTEETRCAPFPISYFRKIPGNAAAANGTRSAAAAYVLIRSLLPRNCPSCRLSRHGRF